jgi:hypothetical protein
LTFVFLGLPGFLGFLTASDAVFSSSLGISSGIFVFDKLDLEVVL